jgi:hypothetical protein
LRGQQSLSYARDFRLLQSSRSAVARSRQFGAFSAILHAHHVPSLSAPHVTGCSLTFEMSVVALCTSCCNIKKISILPHKYKPYFFESKLSVSITNSVSRSYATSRCFPTLIILKCSTRYAATSKTFFTIHVSLRTPKITSQDNLY